MCFDGLNTIANPNHLVSQQFPKTLYQSLLAWNYENFKCGEAYFGVVIPPIEITVIVHITVKFVRFFMSYGGAKIAIMGVYGLAIRIPVDNTIQFVNII